MPKYSYGRPFDIIRVIKQLEKDIGIIKLQIGQTGLPVGGPNVTGSAGSQPVVGGVLSEAPSIYQAVMSDSRLNAAQKEALLKYHRSFVEESDI